MFGEIGIIKFVSANIAPHCKMSDRSYFDYLPYYVQWYVYQFIPYKRAPLAITDEYNVHKQAWKDECMVKSWTGLDPSLTLDENELYFFNRAYFRNTFLKRYFDTVVSVENGVEWRRKIKRQVKL